MTAPELVAVVHQAMRAACRGHFVDAETRADLAQDVAIELLRHREHVSRNAVFVRARSRLIDHFRMTARRRRRESVIAGLRFAPPTDEVLLEHGHEAAIAQVRDRLVELSRHPKLCAARARSPRTLAATARALAETDDAKDAAAFLGVHPCQITRDVQHLRVFVQQEGLSL